MNLSALFSPDSKFMRAVGRIGDLVFLNVYFLICSIPIFTIGAASTALYTVCFRFDTEREQGITRSFFRAFRDNFKQATVLWLFLLLCTVTACINIYLFYAMPGTLHYVFILFAVILVLVLLIAAYAFPLLSQFDNDSKSTLKNAMVLSLAYLPRSIVIVVLNILPIVLILTSLLVFLYSGLIWVLMYFAAAAYLNAWLLRKVFAPYMPTEDHKEEAE